jgi:DNA-binding NtrC family response regulator
MEIMPFLKILLVEDSPADSRLLWEMLRDSGIKGRFTLEPAVTMKEAIKQLSTKKFDLVLLDLMLPDSAGLDTFRAAHKACPDVPVVLLTGLSDENLAARAVREGAQDYLVKGQVDPATLVRSMRYAIERHVAERSFRPSPKPSEEGKKLCPDMVGSSAELKEVRSLIETVARTSNTSVLIMGETGTGKELVANSIHFLSSRRYGPFIKLNCSAIPDTLMEAEMFGYEKGAFTDAKQSKKGLFELADGGTIFLDEIGELSPAIQVKLLRVLQEKEFDRLGGAGTISVDLRIICATQRDLRKEVARGVFREDLFYRLNVVPLVLPPLRERKGDILLLSNHFLKYYAGLYKKSVTGFSVEAMELLLKHPFPGNVRELEHAVERAVVMGRGEEVVPADLPEEIGGDPGERLQAIQGVSSHERLTKAMREFERQYIMSVLDEAKGNKTLAAKLLGVSRKTLWEKCKMLQIASDTRDASGE